MHIETFWDGVEVVAWHVVSFAVIFWGVWMLLDWWDRHG